MGDDMKCPYCDSTIAANLKECPHCHAVLDEVSEPIKEHIGHKKRYLIILILGIVLLLGLLLLNYLKVINKKTAINPKTTTTIKVEPIENSKNEGVYSGLISPVKFGVKTFATLKDTKYNKEVEADVLIVRYLSDGEINEIVVQNNQELIEGFRFVGVVYQIILNDFNYLGNEKISPIFNISVHDYQYHNDFFLVNEHYYKSPVAIKSGYRNIGNNESEQVAIVYQVPIDQSYYLCFGEANKVRGCYDNL